MAHPRERGSISLMMVMLLLLMVVLASVLLQLLAAVQGSAAREQAQAQALCLAESGVQVALHRLGSAGGYRGESATPLAKGSFSVTVRGGSPLEIVATGEAPVAGRLRVRRSVRVHAVASGGRFRVSDWEELP